ncbi:MAG TPA: tRNA epoxyqueuosine(34) reductase QueG [Tissierellia bacterium]|nr:tRNA epoxyqueuosine(34) reductase QueG [Tissierellia bacterium]
MKQIIKEVANKLGIDTVGINSCIDYSYLREFLLKRKINKEDCEFEEVNIDKRLRARNLFPECKSIIAIGIPYGRGYRLPAFTGKGLLSVSSFGEDYHKRIKRLLNKLAEELNKYLSFKYVDCVDTSFLIDKEVCRTAGLGDYGKNSLLINKYQGSFINLGYLLTDLEIEGDTIESKDVCGNCNICVISCPNGAIFPEGGINARKCISYLTQTKNYIPLNYREKMGRQIYGCDICQLVCPKNKEFLNEETNNDYSTLSVDLEELLSISNKDFVKRYGHTAGSWRGKNIWKRNAIISMGNLKLKSMFPLLKYELSNPSEMIKIYTAWSLLEIDRNSAKDILFNDLKYENESVKKEYLKLLESI